MILGIGTDLTDIKRIEEAYLKFGDKFLSRVFTRQEKELAFQRKGQKKWAALASRFAAKEAFAKALGTGLGRYAAFNEIEVCHTETGAPYLSVSGTTAKTLAEKAPLNRIHLSLSDTDTTASAFVIIETDNL